MDWETKNKILYGKYKNLSEYPEIFHGVFARQGGVSEGSYASLNAGFHVGDDAGFVHENRKRISTISGGMLFSVQQVHGTKVYIAEEQEGAIDIAADAIVTNKVGIHLTILTADCQAILVYDPIKKVIANIHSGWRGSIQNIIGATIAVLKDQFSCNPEDVIASIGPSLGPCCAEFVNYKTELPAHFWPYQYKENYFDFWQVSKDQFTDAGVLPKHIEVAGLCSVCHPELFYSYRRDHITGRFATVIRIQADGKK